MVAKLRAKALELFFLIQTNIHLFLYLLVPVCFPLRFAVKFLVYYLYHSITTECEKKMSIDVFLDLHLDQ